MNGPDTTSTSPALPRITILIVEDSPASVQIIELMLSEGEELTFEPTVADRLATARQRLSERAFDVILLDLNLPDSNDLDTLNSVLEAAPQTPIVVLTGLKSETLGQTAIRQGAQDYLVKNEITGPLLVRALCYAIARKQTEVALDKSEQRYLRLADHASDLIYRYLPAPTSKFEYINHAVTALLGYSPEEFYASPSVVQQIVHPDDQNKILSDATQTDQLALPNVVRLFHKNGNMIWAEQSATRVYGGDGQLIAIEGIIRDITERKKMEDALRESQRTLSSLLGNLPGMVYRCTNDEQWTPFFISEGSRDLTGYSPEEFIETRSITFNDLVHADDRQTIYEQIQAATAEKRPYQLTYRIITASGMTKWVWEQGHGIFDDDGNAPLIEGFITDITQRVEAEEALTQSEARFRLLYEGAPLAYQSLDSEGRILEVNQAWLALLGYSRERVIGQPLTSFMTLPAQAAFQKNFSQFKRAGHVHGAEFEMVRADGECIVVQAEGTLARDQSGNIKQTHCILYDITGRKRVEEERAWRAEVDAALAACYQPLISSGSTVDDITNTILHWARQLTGSTEGYISSVDPALRPGAESAVPDNAGEQAGEGHILRVPILRDGEQAGQITLSNPDRAYTEREQAAVERLAELYGLAIQRKRAEEAEHNQRKFAEALRDIATALNGTLDLDAVMNRILDSVGRVVPHDAVSIMLIDGDCVHIPYWQGDSEEHGEIARATCLPLDTPNLYQMIETRRFFIVPDTSTYADWTDLEGSDWIKSHLGIPIVTRGQVIGFLALDSGTPGFFTEELAERLEVFASQAAIAVENAQLYDEISRHASDLEQRVEERTAELQRIKEHLEAVINSSSDAIILTDIDGRIEQTNAAFHQMLHYTPGETIGQFLSILADVPYAAALTEAYHAVARTGQPQRIEVSARRKDGPTFDADIAMAPIVEANNRVGGIECSLRDNSAHKQLERQLRQTLQQQMELNDLKSRFVSIASHELRTPLAVMRISSDLLLKYGHRLTEENKRQELTQIQNSIHRMVALLDDVLTISYVESGKLSFNPSRVDLLLLCRNAIDDIGRASGKKQHISLDVRGEVRQLCLDPKLLKHILSNLLSNAVKYSPNNTPIELDIRYHPRTIVLKVTDHGIGIPHDEQRRLFDAFFRASNVGNIAGTGLGLAIIKQATELHGGTLTYESNEGTGTVFTITLPVASAEDKVDVRCAGD